MKPPPFDYVSATSVEEALEALAQFGPDAKLLAGGQSLVPMLNLRLARPSVLVDLNGISDLDALRSENGSVRIGALARQSAVDGSQLVRDRLPLLAEALPYVGHFATRNRGTVGGSIVHADPAAELPLVLTVLGGSVVAASTRAPRTIPAEALFVSHFLTTLEPDELVVDTVWPAAPPGSGYAFEELAQRRGDYGLCIAACALTVRDGRIEQGRVALGSVTDRPLVVDVGLTGAAIDAATARAAGEEAAAAVDPPGNLHASSAYLKQLTRVLVERAVGRAWRNALEAP
ncbi:MAG TPA: FAD binding domain-containing protein [Gaiellaceae bacterium]|nr:FAD binding domain-containing protein [Gaiellaceae bacterium]